jgi:hypothetical protein
MVYMARKLCVADNIHISVSSSLMWLLIDIADNITSPSFSHALVGLVTTLVNVFTAQGGHFSVTAKVTIIVVVLCGGTMLASALRYHRRLNKIMTPRDRELARHGKIVLK